jgi:hypothetical protein
MFCGTNGNHVQLGLITNYNSMIKWEMIVHRVITLF